MSTTPLTIYLPATLAVQIKRAAERDHQSQSSYVVDLLTRHFGEQHDPLSALLTGQLSRLLAVAEEWVETLPEGQKERAKLHIEERASKYKRAAQARLKA
jgi:hypothetical protein